MTISADYGPLIDSGNGTTKNFSVTFPFDEKADIFVTLFDTVNAVDVAPPPALNGAGAFDYSVSGTSDPNTGIYPSGTITFNTAPPGGWNVVRARKTPQLQPVSLLDNARFPAKTVEGEFDRLELQIQEIDNVASRAIVAPASDGPVDLTLPPAAERAGMMLGFDAMGSPETVVSSGEVEAAIAAFLAGVAPIAPNAAWAMTLAAAKALYAASVVLANGQVVHVACRAGITDGYGGSFAYKAGDSTTVFSQDALGFVDNQGRRFFRIYDEAVSVKWFGAKGDGSADDTAALQAALAAGRDVYVPHGVYLVANTLQMTAAYQTLFGDGLLTEIRLTFSTPKNGIEIIGLAEGRQTIRNLCVNGTGNVAKLLSVAARQVTIRESRFDNATSGGHGVYVEDENVPNALFSFGLILDQCVIHGSFTAGAIGVRLGLNSQTARVTNCVIERWGIHVAIQNAADNMVIENNVLEGSVTYAIDLNHAGSAAFMAAVSIEKNHFEENQIVIHANTAEFHNLVVRRNFAYRNTAAKPGSIFYWGDTGAGAATDSIFVENNFIEDFATAFQLDGEYTARLRGTRGNDLLNVTTYSAGTYAENAYSIRTINSYYMRRLTSGTFPSESNFRLECLNTIFEVPIAWQGQEYLEKITFLYAQVSGTGVTVELHKITSQSFTDTLMTQITANTDGIKTIPVGAYGDSSFHYYLKVTVNNVGGAGYVYPFRAFFR